MQSENYEKIFKKFDSWLNQISLYSESAKANYLSITRNFLRYLESFSVYRLSDANLDLLLKFVQFKGNERYAASFIGVRLSSLSLFYKWAYKYGYCRKNLIIEYRKTKLNAKSSLDSKEQAIDISKDLISLEEQDILINAKIGNDPLAVRNKCIVLLILASALYAEEVLTLSMDTLNLERGYLDISKTDKRARKINLDMAMCKSSCLHWLKQRNIILAGKKSDYLFVTRSGTSLTKRMLYKVISQYLLQCGITKKHLGAEILRQTSICNMVKQGLSLEEIQANTGLGVLTNEKYHKSAEEI